ncbi:zinc finger protein 395-like [Echeneis naucrates]|uniref:Zinc finger protein 395-like n=1 Tax=Echeneis naucrates TaxID=173247 RepID=A0A665WV77_ECHNA|nr:zinc finger protein 395-like [Echeneis naucrates]XP_029354843.1 zinc finger protein 395-like [Echeneis naucrates]
MLPRSRLGKRSPLGALVSPTCPPPGAPTTNQDTGTTAATLAGEQPTSGVKGHLGLKVYFQRGGEAGPDQLDFLQADLSAWSSSHPSLSSSSSSSSVPQSRSVSSCIDVPRSQRCPQEVDMDELMAAMVLSSLSCSPLLHSAAQPDTTASPMDCGSGSGGGGGDLSDSCSSGYWSVGHANGSPVPSPPITEGDTSPTTPSDEGLDMELEQVLFDEPAPRKRRNSVKVAYRCLWPTCGKVLTTVVGIKRHIRTTHLCRGGEHERCSRSEEDFYYTEVIQRDHHHQQQQRLSPPHSLHCGPAPSSTSPSPPPLSPPSTPSPTCGVLSRSAPSSGSFQQVQSEHSYQALPPSHVISAAVPVSTWTAPPTNCHRQGLSFRVRSVSVGEQWLQHPSSPCRRIRGEAKKCRKVYGIEHRDQWCTACRWKKACQRFLD